MNVTTGPSYLKFQHGSAEVHRTWQVSDSVLVDLDAEGRVIGVENLSGPHWLPALYVVMQAAQFTGPLPQWPQDKPRGGVSES